MGNCISNPADSDCVDPNAFFRKRTLDYDLQLAGYPSCREGGLEMAERDGYKVRRGLLERDREYVGNVSDRERSLAGPGRALPGGGASASGGQSRHGTSVGGSNQAGSVIGSSRAGTAGSGRASRLDGGQVLGDDISSRAARFAEVRRRRNARGLNEEYVVTDEDLRPA